MRMDEVLDAEAELALWRLINDSVWRALDTQRQQQAAQDKAKPKARRAHASRPAPAAKPPAMPKPQPNPKAQASVQLPQGQQGEQRKQASPVRKPVTPFGQKPVYSSKNADKSLDQDPKNLAQQAADRYSSNGNTVVRQPTFKTT
jgi:hypothetical protein